MSLSIQDIAGRPDFLGFIQQQAKAMVELDRQHAKMATAFRTQQRWKLGQLSLALYLKSLRDPEVEGLNAARFLEEAERLGIASRNTADTFLQQMIAFGALQPLEPKGDRRKRFLRPAPFSLEIFDDWLSIYLATLDRLDGGARVQSYRQDRDAIAVIQPLVAELFLPPMTVRQPEAGVSPFIWANNGFIVTEHLVMGLDAHAMEGDRFFTSVTAISDLAAVLNMSRSNAAQKLREAETLGAIGWEGARGRSRMWLSRELVDTYLGHQAGILAHVDHAYASHFAA